MNKNKNKIVRIFSFRALRSMGSICRRLRNQRNSIRRIRSCLIRCSIICLIRGLIWNRIRVYRLLRSFSRNRLRSFRNFMSSVFRIVVNNNSNNNRLRKRILCRVLGCVRLRIVVVGYINMIIIILMRMCFRILRFRRLVRRMRVK